MARSSPVANSSASSCVHSSSGGSSAVGKGEGKFQRQDERSGGSNDSLDDGDAHTLGLGNAVGLVEASSSAEGVQAVLKLGVTETEGAVEVLLGDGLGDVLSLEMRKRRVSIW